jgi:hypothetical protein
VLNYLGLYKLIIVLLSNDLSVSIFEPLYTVVEMTS